MKIRNLAGFLLVVILLATGTTPVIAHEVSQCGAVEPLRPGDTLTDAVADAPAAHIDITEVETSLSGERLTVVFHLKDLPETLRFNRTEHGKGSKEYEWEVAIDADNDRGTGPGGYDYLLSAYHIAFLSHEGTEADVTAPIGEMLEAAVWEPRSGGSTSTLADADLAVSAEEETITISGHIPGITSASRLTFSAYDVEFAGEADQMECHAPYRESMGPWGCDAGAAVTGPGQTATDGIEGATDPHMDITQVSTSLSGETLTVVFHLRDVPETLTFNRTGASENYLEYAWVVVVDVDNDRETGSGGFEYQMLASYSVPPSEAESNVNAPIENEVKVSVWSLEPGRAVPAADAALEVSPEEDTLTLSGRIPGITTASRLAFRTYDFSGSFDEVGCFNSQSQISYPGQCDTDDAVTPGQTYADETADVRAGHIDITEVETSLSGERLTVVFHLRDVPETLTFNRTGISENYGEYGWKVLIDVDNDRETGSGGTEYLLSASHFVPSSEKGNNAKASIESKVEAGVLKARADGFVSMIDATLEVSPEEDTITLSGAIPGITAESQLTFETYDYFGGSDGVGCPARPGRSTSPSQDAPASRCTDAEPTVAPGTTATDDISDVSAAYLDISKVSTSLSGEVLTVMFHFRDIPETLTFNRTGIPAGSMEYMWEVSVDVDADPEAGDGGFEYLLSAHHIVWPAHAGDNTEAPIEEVAKADVWEMQPGGRTSVLQDASLEVSAETDTIVLSGRIPGITPDSRLSFQTHEYLGEYDDVGCQEPTSNLTSSSQCDSDEAVTPGESVSVDVSDALPAHVDVTEISTSLSGEKLTVVFHFRDVPEKLTFDRSGVPEEVVEYSWEVSVDMDGDPESGFEGIEYILSSIYVTPPVFSARDRSAAIATDDVQTNTWVLKSAGEAFPDIDFLSWARIEVSAEEDTITLSGEIPGITADSRLTFGVYDYLGGEEEIGCLTSFSFGRLGRHSPSDGSAAVSDSHALDDVSHELVGHIDIRGVTTALDGETLTVTFQLRDVPETLTFDRTDVPAHALEYSWEVSVDVDNDAETGAGGFDFMLSAGYVVHPLVQDGNTAAGITDPGFVTAGILGLDAEGNRVVAEADIEVSAGENRITLSGEIPGITAESPLKFKAYDYFGGSVEMSSHGPSITGVGTDSCQSDSAAIRPGQSVVDAVSETLPAYMDITEISTVLTDDGKLAVVFHLRDVPETLEFNRKDVPKDALEYRWGVSVDVVDDRETGVQAADYSLSASHFVFSPSNDEGVHQPIGEAVQTDTWKMDPDGHGAAYLSSAGIEVSSEENTITLVGDIPGITAASRLEFEAYDFLHGSEQVACQVLSKTGGGE